MKLCSERLNRILQILEQKAGTETLRQFTRIHSIWQWEVEKAEEWGFVKIEIRKPHTGRPSKVVSLSTTQPRNYPPSRSELGKPISHRLSWFAFLTVYATLKGGSKFFISRPGYIEAYLQTHPNAKSRKGAYASCSRLLRHPHVFAARQWYYAQINGDIPKHWNLPRYEKEIWEHLEVMGSYRAKYKPTLTHHYTERRW